VPLSPRNNKGYRDVDALYPRHLPLEQCQRSIGSGLEPTSVMIHSLPMRSTV
jgi:hypothetical protein